MKRRNKKNTLTIWCEPLKRSTFWVAFNHFFFSILNFGIDVRHFFVKRIFFTARQMIDFSHSVCNIRIYFSRLLKCHYLSYIHIFGIFCWNMAINECNTTEEKKNTCNIILNGFWVTILWECTDVAETCLDMKDSIVSWCIGWRWYLTNGSHL